MEGVIYMVEFLCITGAFLLLTCLVMDQLIYGIKVDSTEGDLQYRWSSFSCSREDMNL